ncbi:MAG: fumarylacetoacetate hydrolase family protein [Chloroflexota bacterium]
MYLTRHQTDSGPRWALDGSYLPETFRLSFLLSVPKTAVFDILRATPVAGKADDLLLAPIDDTQEVWACGVTYLRSRDARQAESNVADVYERVYDAERPEVFFKALGWRVKGHGQGVRVRRDSNWNVPEPEFTLVVNAFEEIVGYCVGNDVSSRAVEGENPLYLPQAKSYNGSCSLGPGLHLLENPPLTQLPIAMKIERAGETVYQGETNISQMKRKPQELVDWLGRELDFPQGVFVMTGTGLVPEDAFTLQVDDRVRIQIGNLVLENEVD